MRNWVFILLAAVACNSQPHSKDPIYEQKDDRLSLTDKVALLRTSSAINDDALLTSISLLYAQNKNWVEAKETISKAIKLNPVNATYHLYLANYNAELANNLAAYEEAKVAFELGTYDKKLEGLLARMSLETADTVNSNKFVSTYYQANKQSGEAKILMARLYLLENKYDSANKLAQVVLAKDTTNTDAIKILYKSNAKMDSTSLAIYYGEKLLKTDSLNAQYYFELANMYLTQGHSAQAANYFVRSYKQLSLISSLYLAIGNYTKLGLNDSVIFYSDSAFAGKNASDEHLLLMRARAFSKRYKYDDAIVVYNRLVKMDSTDSVVNAEHALVQRKISYLWRKNREQKQLADSLANSMPIINF